MYNGTNLKCKNPVLFKHLTPIKLINQISIYSKLKLSKHLIQLKYRT